MTVDAARDHIMADLDSESDGETEEQNQGGGSVTTLRMISVSLPRPPLIFAAVSLTYIEAAVPSIDNCWTFLTAAHFPTMRTGLFETSPLSRR